MELLLDRRGNQIQITKNVVKIAIRNKRGGKQVIALLLNRRGDQIPIIKDVVTAAAGNSRALTELLDRQGGLTRR